MADKIKIKSDYENKTLPGIHPRIKVTEKFIKKNNFELVRTQREIVGRYHRAKYIALNFEAEILINYLTFESAKPFLKEDIVKKIEAGEETWAPIPDLAETVQDMLDYLVFGWMKAMDERGISAVRTIQKLGTWLWLLNRIDLELFIRRDDLYNPYGAPALVRLTEKLGIDVPNDLFEFARKNTNIETDRDSDEKGKKKEKPNK